jgi:hypothetical protein
MQRAGMPPVGRQAKARKPGGGARARTERRNHESPVSCQAGLQHGDLPTRRPYSSRLRAPPYPRIVVDVETPLHLVAALPLLTFAAPVVRATTRDTDRVHGIEERLVRNLGRRINAMKPS